MLTYSKGAFITNLLKHPATSHCCADEESPVAKDVAKLDLGTETDEYFVRSGCYRLQVIIQLFWVLLVGRLVDLPHQAFLGVSRFNQFVRRFLTHIIVELKYIFNPSVNSSSFGMAIGISPAHRPFFKFVSWRLIDNSPTGHDLVASPSFFSHVRLL